MRQKGNNNEKSKNKKMEKFSCSYENKQKLIKKEKSEQNTKNFSSFRKWSQTDVKSSSQKNKAKHYKKKSTNNLQTKAFSTHTQTIESHEEFSTKANHYLSIH